MLKKEQLQLMILNPLMQVWEGRMSEEDVWWCCKGAAGICALLLFLLFLRILAYHPEKKLLLACEGFAGMLREREQNTAWYRRKGVWLVKNGAAFHYGRWVNPARYLTLCTVLALLGLLAIGRVSWAYGILAGVLLFFLPDWLLEYLNRQDNIRLLPEIKLIYHALEIQIRAGVYVTDALAECYGSVQERRLQSALLDLTGDIVMKADIYESMEHLQGKFDNRYIDSLCITILQACESGQAVELLGDIGEQLKDMEAAVMSRKKNNLDRSVTFYQLGVLCAVLGVILYACVSHMFAAAVQF